MRNARGAVFSPRVEGKALGIMGIVNVTPDSFSDGGLYFDVDRAILRGHEMAASGADIIDVGGESSRPGADPVPEDEELRRVLPVVAELSKSYRVSIDTFKAGVAERALEAGATLVNDISAKLAPVAARYGSGWVAMHMQGSPQTMQRHPVYEDVLSEVMVFLSQKVEWARSLGVSEVWVDPGIGFGKGLSHNLEILAQLERLQELGAPVVVGASRKAFLGRIVKASTGVDSVPSQRMEPSLASSAWCYLHGATMMRVHDVAETRQLLDLIEWNTSTPSADQA